MRFSNPLILGAGPAGCAAAIALAKRGASPLLIDRDEEVGDPLCGGFLSWRTVEQLDLLGVDCRAEGAHRVSQLRLFDGKHVSSLGLPKAAYGLSRHALDTAMRRAAREAGASFEFDHIRRLSPNTVHGRSRDWQTDSIFLATGKHDVRGQSRPRTATDTTLGLRLRLPPSPRRQDLLAGTIELHLFAGGYVGIVLQEGGSANLCLAVRKSALSRAGGSPRTLLETLARRSSALAQRLGPEWQAAPTDTIGAVPYGWICRDTTPGLFRLGDQAAVIPSLAGEGISIALVSGVSAAAHWLEGGAPMAPAFQSGFAKHAQKPVRLASLAWKAAETRIGSRATLALARVAPGIVAQFADWARIDAPRTLAPH